MTKSKKHTERCQRYKVGRKRETNKVKKLRKHLKEYPEDKQAIEALDRLHKVTGGV